MSKIIAVNGSPRKNMNTSALLESFLSGASASGTETELINLYDFLYSGCRECGGCKLLGGGSYGKCALRDDITPILEKLSSSDGIVFGSPIFFADVTGNLRSFMERFLYPYSAFIKDEPRSIAPKKIHTAFIYTMNASEEVMQKLDYPSLLAPLQNSVERVFSFEPEVLFSYFTYQYNNYEKYASSLWDESAKAKQREIQFPIDLRKASEMGSKMAMLCSESSK